MQKEIQQSNNYLVKQLPKATVFVNRKNIVIHASDQWVYDFEVQGSKVIGNNIMHLFKDINSNWRRTISESLAGLPNLILTEKFIDDCGNIKWFELHSIPWYDEKENVKGTILQAQDVTQRVLSESKLEKLEILSEDISDNADIGFWDYNLAEDKMFWDKRTRAIHEVCENFVPSFTDSYNFYKLGNSRNTFSMVLNKAITSEVAFSEKLQLITGKGHEVWVITSGKPLFENGKLTGIVGTIQDITERETNAIKSRENEHLLRTLIDNLPLNVYIKDLESRKILVNKAEIEYCGYTVENEVLGKDDFSFFDKKTAEICRKDDLSVMRELKPILSKETLHMKKDGSSTTFLTSKIPLIDTDGHAYGLVGISLDISDRKQKELELRKLVDVTYSQNEKLINFAHIVSHNLRSHSANFSMLLNFLAVENSEEEREKMMKMLLDSSDNLLETLDNLNEVVHIHSSPSLLKKRFSLNKRIEAIEKNLIAHLNLYDVKIINLVEKDISINIVPAYIDSILTNFMTNGIKYRSLNRDSFIKFSVTREGNYIVLHIEDNGIGIDLDRHGDKLFGMYKTFHDNKDAKGIGLYITKNQIEAMDGKIKVDSKVGEGTTFKIYFNEKN